MFSMRRFGGPWHVSANTFKYIYDSDGKGVASVDLYDGSDSVLEARSTLIALAPEMFEAIEEALSELETIDQNLADGRETYVSDTRLDLLRSIVARVPKA